MYLHTYVSTYNLSSSMSVPQSQCCSLPPFFATLGRFPRFLVPTCHFLSIIHFSRFICQRRYVNIWHSVSQTLEHCCKKRRLLDTIIFLFTFHCLRYICKVRTPLIINNDFVVIYQHIHHWRRDLHDGIVFACQDMKAMGREIESRQGIGWKLFIEKGTHTDNF
jgi:hypothetical protein